MQRYRYDLNNEYLHIRYIGIPKFSTSFFNHHFIVSVTIEMLFDAANLVSSFTYSNSIDR